jgi:hypothetical protein
MAPVETTEAAADPFFRKVVSIATGLAFGGMLATLAVFERGSHGKLSLRWHWAAIPLLLLGLGLGLQFWRILWKAQSEGTPSARTSLRRFSIFLAIVAVTSFAYPMRYIQSGRRGEVFAGLGLAIVVLTCFGFLIWKTIQWVNSNEPEDGQTDAPPDR